MTDYEKLLDEALSKVKRTESTGERFEIPKVEGRFEGKKTAITNFFAITSYLRREPEHFLKYLSRELATPAVIENERVILNKRVSSREINPKIESYVKEFVTCKQCGKPDTEIVKEGKANFMKCLACGAKQAIRTKI
jgi:translation initiation factor 2 subunit 2